MTLALNTGLWAKFRALFGEAQGTGSSDIDVDGDVKRAYEKTLCINIDPTTNINANTTLRHFFEAKDNMDILEVKYIPDGSVTVNASNYLVMRLLSGTGAAAAATAVATANTSTGSNWAAGTTVSLTNVTAELDIDADKTLGYDIKKYGTAGGMPACPKGGLVIHYRER
jgi:hypothetical protein